MKKHTHSLERFKTLKGNPIYKCMIPGCPTYFSTPELAIGQMNSCPTCGREFSLTKEHIKMKKPLCNDCREIRVKKREAFWAGTFVEESE